VDNSNWIQLGIYVVTLAMGAATMRTELKYLRKDMTEFKETVEKASKMVAATLGNHGERIAKIEGRMEGAPI
jgi:methanogenic corrinoid protein MtbC1